MLADCFGYHALQLGMPGLQALRANRMPSRWVAVDEIHSTMAAAQGLSLEGCLHCDFHALPFPSKSLDLVVLPHTLELSADPHQTLREVERVLVPEGRVVITGFNPASLWGVSRRWNPQLRAQGDWMPYWRLRDWLRLLSFEIEGGRFGCYQPHLAHERWQERLRWMDRLGDRWWPVLGSVYALSAVKRLRGLRVVGLQRSARRAGVAPAPVVANRHPSASSSLNQRKGSS